MASSRGGMGLAPPMLGMLSLSVAGSISASASAACKAISTGSAETQIFPEAALNGDYFTAKNHYWSAANADSTPACVVFPTNAQEVSSVVRILQNYTTVDFAMKSGGHNPNVGWSSTDGGVLISFSKLASTTYNSKDQTAEIGTGSRWGQAATALDPYNVTVVGGRLGDVGVGGLVLGCGLSFLSAQYGLPCDSVVNYEVVLPDASIINANANSNSDLFWALKGGGNQFGIVTKFTMKTFPIGQIWGGTRIYSADKAEALINATHDLVSDYDPRAAVIVTGESTIDTLVDIFVVFFFYNAETPGKALDAFNAIEPLVDNVKVQSYADMVNANSEFSLYGFRYLIRGTTLPNLPSTQGRDLFNTHYKMWFNYVKPHALLSLLNAGFVFSIAYQPMPAVIPSASGKINPAGNTLGLDAKYGDHIWMEYDISWLSSIHDDEAHAMAMNITAAINEYAKSTYAGVKNTNYKEGDVMDEEYNPTFLNDAMYDQKPLQSYGNGNYNKMKAIQRKYDPHGFFPGRTGGFKFT